MKGKRMSKTSTTVRKSDQTVKGGGTGRRNSGKCTRLRQQTELQEGERAANAAKKVVTWTIVGKN